MSTHLSTPCGCSPGIPASRRRPCWRWRSASASTPPSSASSTGCSSSLCRSITSRKWSAFRGRPRGEPDRFLQLVLSHLHRLPGQATSFAGLAAYADSNAVHLTVGAGKPQRLIGGLVSGSYFDVLRAKAWRGRLIGPDDDRKPGGHPVAVISYGLWRRSFGGRDDAIGQHVRINSHPFTVIGVAPPGFVGVSLDNLPEALDADGDGEPRRCPRSRATSSR